MTHPATPSVAGSGAPRSTSSPPRQRRGPVPRTATGSAEHAGHRRHATRPPCTTRPRQRWGRAPGRPSLPRRGPRDSLGKPSREGIPAPAWSQRWSRAPETALGLRAGPSRRAPYDTARHRTTGTRAGRWLLDRQRACDPAQQTGAQPCAANASTAPCTENAGARPLLCRATRALPSPARARACARAALLSHAPHGPSVAHALHNSSVARPAQSTRRAHPRAGSTGTRECGTGGAASTGRTGHRWAQGTDRGCRGAPGATHLPGPSRNDAGAAPGRRAR